METKTFEARAVELNERELRIQFRESLPLQAEFGDEEDYVSFKQAEQKGLIGTTVRSGTGLIKVTQAQHEESKT